MIEVREVLLESVLNGYSAALCVVGGPGTGKSRCLFGAHDLKSGLLPEFAETYYRRRGQQAAIGVIDVSVSQVYGEQVRQGVLERIYIDCTRFMTFSPRVMTVVPAM